MQADVQNTDKHKRFIKRLIDIMIPKQRMQSQLTNYSIKLHEVLLVATSLFGFPDFKHHLYAYKQGTHHRDQEHKT